MAQSQEHSVWRLSEVGGGPTALKLHREPVPTPGPGQYLVRIHAVSLNYRDIAYANGTYPGSNLKSGLVLCADMAGEIISAGQVRLLFLSRVMKYGLMRDSECYQVQAW